MKKILVITIYILSIAKISSAQLIYNHAFALGNTASDQGASIAADGSGNYYCTGSVTYWMNANPLGTPFYTTNNGGQDIYVAKYNSSGIMSWAIDIGGIGDDAPIEITLDAGNNVYITGRFRDTVDFNPGIGTASRMSNGGTDIFLAKYDNNGIFQWVNTFGGSQSEQGWDVTADAVSANIIVTGVYQSQSMDMDAGSGIHTITNNGNAALNNNNCFVAAYNQSTGAYQWAFNIGAFDGATGYKVSADIAGNIYVGGTVTGDSADFDPGNGTSLLGVDGKSSIFLAKYTGGGALVWANGTVGPGGVTANSLACDNGGNVYQGGFFNGFFGNDTIDMDPGPGTVWLQTNGTQDAYVRKFNSAGQLLWAFSVGGLGSEVTQDLVLDNAGHFFITGNFGATVDFDPGTGVHNLTEIGSNFNGDAYIAEYDLSANFINAIPISGDGYEFGVDLCIIPPNKLGVIGFFSSDTIDFDPGPAVHNLYVTGGNNIFSDGFVATYTTGPVGIEENIFSNQFHIYPNPANDEFTVYGLQFMVGEHLIRIFDVMGKEIYSAPTTTSNLQFQTSNFPNGIYFVQLQSENIIATQKLIIQH